MTRSLRSVAPLAFAAALGGCGARPGGDQPFGGASLRLSPAPSPASLTTPLRGARLVPDAIELERTFGVEPGGGLRGIAAGVRVVRYPSGAIAASPDRLTQTPSSTAVLPDRLGGGVLFALGDTLWRADKWLAPAVAVFRAPGAIRSLWIGLDRVVLRVTQGSSLMLVAVDPRSGTPLDLGALPTSPWITGYAALDGFRAVALADLRGVVVTTDAGATWRPLPVPIEPRELTVTDGTITVNGTSARETQSFEVRPEGDVTRVKTSSARNKSDPAEPSAARAPDSEATKLLGRRPLALAVTDGLPLADGSVLVATAGTLARLRLQDGAVLDLAPGAFPLRGARCHAIAVETGGGFVCAEPRGATHVYRYREADGTLAPVLAFRGPRVVLAGGSGALAVRGPCAEETTSPSPVPGTRESEVTYCVRSAGGELHEQRLTGIRDTARVVPLADGKLVVISPPTDGSLGQLAVVTSDGAPKSASLIFDEVDPTARLVLTRGMWLDGFEERGPGVYGGWVEHAGTMLGVEIRADGHARHGQFVRDPGLVVVGGRFGLAWLGSQHGFETIDGGLTWRNVELPDRLERDRASVGPHGCSALGCALAGWLRIGYGDGAAPTAPPAHAAPIARAPSLAPLELDCQMVAGVRPRVVPSVGRVASAALSLGVSGPRGGGELTPFYGVAPPTKRAEEIESQYEIQELVDHQRNLGALARVYVWGQKGLEFDASARWLLRWSPPFSSSSSVYSTPTATPPRPIIEAARFAAGGPTRSMASLAFATSDDPESGLLIGSRSGATGMESFITILDAARAPVEARRADGEPWSPVSAATRLEGRWFVVTEPAPSEPTAAVLWEIEAGVGREIARAPRVEAARSGGNVRLARRVGESLVGLVLEGPPAEPGRGPRRWVLPVDVTTGRILDLEPMGADSDGRAVGPCSGDEGGWVVDVPLGPREIRVTVGGQRPAGLRSGYARMHYTQKGACVSGLVASYDGDTDALDRASAGRASDHPVTFTMVTGGGRRELRCRAPQMATVTSLTGSR